MVFAWLSNAGFTRAGGLFLILTMIVAVFLRGIRPGYIALGARGFFISCGWHFPGSGDCPGDDCQLERGGIGGCCPGDDCQWGERRVHLVVAVFCTMLLLDVIATMLGQGIGSDSFVSVAMLYWR